MQREEAVRRAAEAVAERGEEREKLEAQRREEAALQRENSVLRQLQRKDEELARKQRELDDYKRDQALRMDRVSSSRPPCVLSTYRSVISPYALISCYRSVAILAHTIPHNVYALW